MHIPIPPQLLLRLCASLTVVLALGGIGPGWLPTAAIAAAIVLSPPFVDAAAALTSGGLPGLRQRARRRWFGLSLAVIVACGVGIRLAGIGIGLWHEPLDVDERHLGDSVLAFFRTGTLVHSGSEDHPGLHFWIATGAALVGYLWALMSGLITSIDDVTVELFVGAGRIANVGLWALTAACTALIGRSVAGPAAGLLAAAIFVVSPLSLETSTQMRNDVGMAAAVVACVYAALAMCDRPTRAAPWIAGALAGIAAGIKVTAVFVVLPSLLAAAWAPGRRKPLQATALVLAGFLIALAISNHFIWSDFATFVHQISDDYGHVQPGHFAYASSPRTSYLLLIAGYGVGWPLLLSAGAYAAYALASGRRNECVFVAFPIAYLWFMTQKTALFTRWAYVLIPFVAVAGAAGLLAASGAVARLVQRVDRHSRAAAATRWIPAAIYIALLIPFVSMSAVAISHRFTRPTYALAETWLTGIAADGDRVLAQADALDLGQSGVEVVRVANLGDALNGADAEWRTAKWIVVQEPQFGMPALANLLLVKEFVASMAFGGNRGLDVRVYVPRPGPPL